MNFSVLARYLFYFTVFIFLLWAAIRLVTPNEEDFSWRLGVDIPVAYSPVIKITDGEITISGSQTNVGEGNAIEYTLVTKDQFGFSHTIDQFIINEDQSFFQHTFTNIPIESDMRVKIENGSSCLCQGKLTIHDSSSIRP